MLNLRNNTNKINNVIILFDESYIGGYTSNIGMSGIVKERHSKILQDALKKITNIVEKANIKLEKIK